MRAHFPVPEGESICMAITRHGCGLQLEGLRIMTSRIVEEQYGMPSFRRATASKRDGLFLKNTYGDQVYGTAMNYRLPQVLKEGNDT